jgi:hypothetical protein
MRRNPLLAKPPRSFHQPHNKVGLPAEYFSGVHTTTDKQIAAAYAIATWDHLGNKGYPVVIALDVRGLVPLPDADAMIQAGYTFKDDGFRRGVANSLSEGKTFDDLLAMEQNDDFMSELGVGDHPSDFLFEQMGQRPMAAVESYATEAGIEPDRVISDWVSSGKIPSRVLMILVDQTRFMDDFDLDRVVQVTAVKPWWYQVMFPPDDDDAEADIERLEGAGWQVWTLDDVTSDGNVIEKVVYSAGADPAAQIEYHGTSSVALEQAFPGLIAEDSPFPVVMPKDAQFDTESD